MTASAARARSGLRDPRVQRVAGFYVLARVPAAAVWLSVVLDVSRASGSYGKAGAAVACFGLGAAAMAPVVGRLADRHGARRVLFLGTLVQLPALLLLAHYAHRSGFALLIPATVAGAAQPPLVACMRAAWRSLVPDPVARRSCLAFDAVLGEVVDLGSPLLAVAINVSAGEQGSLPAVAVASAVAMLGFIAVFPGHERRAAPPGPGRVVARPVLAVLGVVLVLTSALGAVEIGAIAVADSHGDRAGAGRLLAVFAATSVIGGIAYARMSSRRPPTLELALLLLPMSAGLLAAAVFAQGLLVTGALLGLAGFAVAPLVTVVLGLLERVALPGAETVTFTLATTANFLGLAGGSTVAGLAVDATSPPGGIDPGTAGLLVAATCAGACLLLTRAVRALLPADVEALPVADTSVDDLVAELEGLWEELRRTGSENDVLARELAELQQQRQSWHLEERFPASRLSRT